MAMRSVPEGLPGGSILDRACEPCCLARQPILNHYSELHGYELLFWNGKEPARQPHSDEANRTVLDNSLLLGLERLAHGLPAFVHLTESSLTEQWVLVFPPGLTVVEIATPSAPTPEQIEAWRKLKQEGYGLALDDYTGQPGAAPLVDLADYVKVDVTLAGAAARQTLLSGLDGKTVLAVAKNVSTEQEFKHASGEGFTLFQGYYFCHPEPLKNLKIPANRLVHFEILELVQNETFALERLSQLVKCDADLTYRLLRLVNSPVCAVHKEVTSINAALLLLGQKTFRRIATLAIANDLNAGQPNEILRMAFVRGRFCELAADLCGLDSSEQYLLGMVSLFPAMLRMTVEDLVQTLPLREKVRDALLGKQNHQSVLLRWIEALEQCDWTACESVAGGNSLERDALMRCHADAVAWAETALTTAG